VRAWFCFVILSGSEGSGFACHPEERSEEGSGLIALSAAKDLAFVFPLKTTPDPSGDGTTLRMTGFSLSS